MNSRPNAYLPEMLEPSVGLEPTTYRLRSDCSAIELGWHRIHKRVSGIEPPSLAWEASIITIILHSQYFPFYPFYC